MFYKISQKSCPGFLEIHANVRLSSMASCCTESTSKINACLGKCALQPFLQSQEKNLSPSSKSIQTLILLFPLALQNSLLKMNTMNELLPCPSLFVLGNFPCPSNGQD